MASAHKEPERLAIPLSKLVRNPKNANVVPDATMVKLQRNIKRTGHYPPLIVRPLDGGDYMLLDGHHRALVLERLGKTEANCEVWHVTEREGDVMLATLNTLRGSDDLRMRAALIDALSQTVPLDQLAQMLPEDEAQLEDLQKLLQVDLDALDADARAAAEKSDAESPQSITFILYPDQFVKVKNALEHIKTREELHKGKNADGMALYYMSVEYLSGVGYEEAEEAAQNDAPPIGGSPTA